MNSIEASKCIIGVVGTGQMGTQFADYLMQHGYPVILKTRFENKIELIKSKMEGRLAKRMPEESIKQQLENLIITAEYSDLEDVDIVIEASKEDLTVKQEIFSSLSKACKSATIFATNSSSLSTDLLADSTDRPDRFIGMHFFNPIHKMDLVEVIDGRNTSESTMDFAFRLAQDLGKKPIRVRNSPGFIVNRLLMPQINDSIILLSSGIATKEDIDSAIKLGLNHPMGPFELADYIGLDTCLSIINEINAGLMEHRLEPAPLLRTMVEERKLGRKTGEGFYRYR